MTARKGPGWLTIWERAIGLAPEFRKHHAAVRVAHLALARFYGEKRPEFFLSAPMAAELAGVCEKTVQTAFALLIRWGWVVRTRKHTPNDPAYYTLAVPAHALGLVDPVTHKTVAAQLRTSGHDDPPTGGNGYYPTGGNDYHPRVVTTSATGGNGYHQRYEEVGRSSDADGSTAPGGADPRVGQNYAECVACGRPVRLGAALCSDCEREVDNHPPPVETSKAKADATASRLIDEEQADNPYVMKALELAAKRLTG